MNIKSDKIPKNFCYSNLYILTLEYRYSVLETLIIVSILKIVTVVETQLAIQNCWLNRKFIEITIIDHYII